MAARSDRLGPEELAALGSCPAPRGDHEQIVLGHGSGGRLSAELLHRVFLPAFENEVLGRLEDAATCPLEMSEGGRLAFTTDAFVVQPLFFPGGDIGRLAIVGTVNDLAVAGAMPRHVSAAFILEEGLPVTTLERIVASMRATCAEAGVTLVCGDTKVVDRGKGDGVFITTSGVGVVPRGRALSVASARPGDRVLVSGTLGDHGIAVLSVREGLDFETSLVSDCAPLVDLARALLDACPGARCMRDPTRGGLASALTEIATASRVGVRLEEAALPLRPEVRAACEVLGLDPLYVASEGKLVAVVPPADAARALAALRGHPRGRDAALVGEVIAEDPGVVMMRSIFGSDRLVTLLQGEQLPRIC
ncbi:hydrogenase [Sorangium cellulosum]|uniref:Hydrogenase n=1 Tax=Sorangium cellulosum TaxID=56 RepID=A0A2L0F5H1_SORCE|nr:hydrogenase expression/formation protein HypE [Sorangium cellulosum]AUX46838.1 hydrogenase [Sorangium cellulosum]